MGGMGERDAGPEVFLWNLGGESAFYSGHKGRGEVEHTGRNAWRGEMIVIKGKDRRTRSPFNDKRTESVCTRKQWGGIAWGAAVGEVEHDLKNLRRGPVGGNILEKRKTGVTTGNRVGRVVYRRNGSVVPQHGYWGEELLKEGLGLWGLTGVEVKRWTRSLPERKDRRRTMPSCRTLQRDGGEGVVERYQNRGER